ncbi:hypothetical protein BKA82DRAFT_32946 [Pisolithus tinctorius]|uniref:Uncharacterized protein n=1 Tax=Pisolithus tinctorius Marx 270 TaxID=870435 RepID=A0A0C3NNC7_PISTI|nr:hypothetical protein BKA82DRAFT_32946 [Pisolithus tinctorius]KIN96808.1 hypothetical protein M404DRAFT_32946 [Pisolithus tinctorius Marx 270]
MSPDAFKIPNGTLTPVDMPKTAEAATDVFSDLYSLVVCLLFHLGTSLSILTHHYNFSPNSSPPEWATPAAVTMPSTIDPTLLSLNTYPPPDIPANDVPVTEMTGHDTDVDFHLILTFHNTLQAVIHMLDCFLAE